MKRLNLILFALTIFLSSCNFNTKSTYDATGKQSEIIIAMIDAVNKKDAEKYVIGFAEDVEVYVETERKVKGRENLKANRANHFKNHPSVRSEIQHMVEIDNRVILHDKVWFDKTDEKGQNIVEIFTFENGEVTRVDVIQPKDLFN